MQGQQRKRVYHGSPKPATTPRRLAAALTLALAAAASPVRALPPPAGFGPAGIAIPPAGSAISPLGLASGGTVTPPASSSLVTPLAAAPPAPASATSGVPLAATPMMPVQPGLPLSAAAVEARLERGIRDLFATPQSLLAVVPLALPVDEDAKTRRAMDVLFRPARIEELTLKGVTAEGRVASLRLRLSNVNVFGLRVDEIVLDAEDFAVDLVRLGGPGQVALTSDARTRMSARVLEDDLNRVSPAYRLELKHDDFAVSGRAGVLFIRAGYRLHGTLAATDENQVVFRPKSLSYGILPIPRALYAAQVRRLNPLFDMARFLGMTRGGFDLRFERVALEDKRAEVALAGTIHAVPIKVEPLPPPLR